MHALPQKTGAVGGIVCAFVFFPVEASKAARRAATKRKMQPCSQERQRMQLCGQSLVQKPFSAYMGIGAEIVGRHGLA